jgi:hypothetical protein
MMNFGKIIFCVLSENTVTIEFENGVLYAAVLNDRIIRFFTGEEKYGSFAFEEAPSFKKCSLNVAYNGNVEITTSLLKEQGCR